MYERTSHMKRASWRLLAAGFLAASIAICAVSNIARADEPVLRSQQPDNDQRNRQFQRAEALYLSGRYKEAAASFEQLTRAYPRDERIWLKYGNTLTKQGNYDEAANAFQTAASLDSEQGGPALNLALVRLAQAQAALDVALARFAADAPEHAQADSLQRQIRALLGTPERNVPPH